MSLPTNHVPAGRIVLVEDAPDTIALFRHLLRKRLGCEVVLITAPDELLACCRDTPVDLVLMDVSLGGMQLGGRPVDGLQLARALKEDDRTKGIPILLATAHAMVGDRESMLAESLADGYVAKPIVDLTAFVELIRSLRREAA